MHCCVAGPVHGHADDAAVHPDRDDTGRRRQRAGDVATTAVELDPADAQAAQVDYGFPRSAVHLEVPRVVGTELHRTVVAATAALDEHQVVGAELHGGGSSTADRRRDVGAAGRSLAHQHAP